VIEGKSGVTPEMALRLGTFFGNGAELWLGMQHDFDLWRARQKMRTDLAKIKPASDAA
jgi:addiction module HigA family antidote